MGHAGIVLGLEVSRLARNCADWHRLLEICALTDTLILDEDGLYDPADFNDRLLLGLKGTMSEAECTCSGRACRAASATRPAGANCECRCRSAWSTTPRQRWSSIRIDRSSRQRTLLFEIFRERARHLAVVKCFGQQGPALSAAHPPWRRQGARCSGGRSTTPGRCRSCTIPVMPAPSSMGAPVALARPNCVPTTLRCRMRTGRCSSPTPMPATSPGRSTSTTRPRSSRTPPASVRARAGSTPREGVGLLQGRVICGRCGSRMRVRYQKVGERLEPYYQCTEDAVRQGGKRCQSMRGQAIDAAISTLLLKTVAPAAIEVALAVQEEIADRIDQAEALRHAQLERARYEAELARRRYLQVDPAQSVGRRCTGSRLEQQAAGPGRPAT